MILIEGGILLKNHVSCNIQHNIAYMANSFTVSVDIHVKINILYEMIKILREKILNAINLH